MPPTVFNAANAYLNAYDPHPYVYLPRNLRVAAILVTEDNIGGLAIELEAELRYDEDDTPYFKFLAERANADIPDGKIGQMVLVEPEAWIIPLRGELHVYRDRQFMSTFAPGNGRPSFEQVVSRQQGVGSDAWHEAEMHETLAGDAKPTPHPRSENPEVEFSKGCQVTTPNQGAGEVIEGPNDKGLYFVTLEEGGADWYEPADLRLNMRAAQQGQ